MIQAGQRRRGETVRPARTGAEAPIVALEGLTKVFEGNIRAVDGVNLDIAAGEFVTLLGPSGCGKSTLLRMIGGFERPTVGRIRLAGEDVTRLPPHRRDVNMVFQDYALFPHMTVGENVGYGLRMAGRSRAEVRSEVERTLDMVGLADKIGQRPHELSGGQRQRVALARAIVRRPKVLLLDEPLSALDANLREAMQVELKHLHDKIGLTFVMVTHDQTEALVMSDRVVVMQAGRVAQSGTPADLYDRPASPYIADFIGSTNFLRGRMSGAADGLARLDFHGSAVLAEIDGWRPDNGAEVLFGIRPEKARLVRGTESPVGATVLTGEVVEVLYHGRGVKLVIRLAGGERFVVEELLADRMGRSELPPPGAAVTVAAEPRQVFLFDESPGGAR